MSSVEDTPELKAGHAPAVKVGGMRVATQNRPNSNNNDKVPAAPAAEKVEGGENDELLYPEPEKTKDPALYISGALVKEARDFPAQAVKSYHEKPETQNNAYTLRDTGSHPKQVFQPRKQ